MRFLFADVAIHPDKSPGFLGLIMHKSLKIITNT
jgi:hypothetical protein